MDQGESVYDTALRETEEEIGISSKDIDIWTTMSKVQGRDPNMVITPVVGVLKNFDMAKVRPNEQEVAEVFTVPLKEFCNKEHHASIVVDNFNIPVYNCGKHRIWGITGLITHLFLQCILPEDIYETNFLNKSDSDSITERSVEVLLDWTYTFGIMCKSSLKVLQLDLHK